MNVLVIVANELSIGAIGCYGNEWVETPTFDRLAAEGVVFDQHIADDPTLEGAARAWRTGCYGLPAMTTEASPSESNARDLFAVLRDNDIRTILVGDTNENPQAANGWERSQNLHAHTARALHEAVCAAALQTLSQIGPSRGWLMRVEIPTLLMSAEVPAAFDREQERHGHEAALEAGEEEMVAPELGRADQKLLAAEIGCADRIGSWDAGLGKLLHELRGRGYLDETLIVVTTDFGRASDPQASQTLNEELVHLPLLLRFPNCENAGRRVFALTQTIDLLPTFFGALGRPVPLVHGQSVLPLAAGNVSQVRAYACSGGQRPDRTAWLLRTPQWSFHVESALHDSESKKRGLYVKPDDRWEVNDVCQHHQDFVEQLEQTLQGLIEATRRPGPLQPPDLPKPETDPAPTESPLTETTT
jgi:arylsulfatase A-like enzyme